MQHVSQVRHTLPTSVDLDIGADRARLAITYPIIGCRRNNFVSM